ncbi:hypothetical protein G9A89_010050 [Geosiphon pyriformis]|nr:hypothetical protein G9A89_010050 [Geosiphon pyriformis]
MVLNVPRPSFSSSSSVLEDKMAVLPEIFGLFLALVFTSGLDVEFHGAEVAIIMNNSLAWHVSKVDEVLGHLISVRLLFKNKLSVMILGLYAGVSISTWFSQAANINSMVSKVFNFSSFVVLGGNFNENRSSRSVNFKFCLGLGLVNTFDGHLLAKASIWSNSRGVEKVIDFILVSRNLASAVALHIVNDMSEFFDTDYKLVSILIGLAFADKPTETARSDMFEETRVNGDLNTMWKLLEEAIVQTANTVFSRIWYSEYDCLRNKQSFKFFKLELLVAKIVKCWNSGDLLNFNHLIKIWLAVDAVEASKVNSMVLNDISPIKLIKHLSVIKKGYCKSKYYEFKYYESKIAEDTAIRKTIDYHMENFCSDKEKIIKSILECLFHKVVLDHLVMDDELVVEPNKVKLKVDKIIKGWTKK